MTDETHILIESPNLSKDEIESLIGTRIKNMDLFRAAFTHKSALKRYNLPESFETLEFMGDSVLNFVITKFLFDQYKDRQEGFLTKARTKLVRGDTLANIASKLGLYKWILMDEKGERNEWMKNPKVLEDVFEALIGAIYMDSGLLHAKTFILKLFTDEAYVYMNAIMIDDNFKDILMRYCQSHKYNLPDYQISSHVNGLFKMVVIVNGQYMGHGLSKNKKQAEQIAAYHTLKFIGQIV